MMKTIGMAFLGVLMYIVYVLDRVLLAVTFYRLKSFAEWCEVSYWAQEGWNYNHIQHSVWRVFLAGLFAIIWALYVWWVALMSTFAVLFILGIIGYKNKTK
jgi:hypothetical protein